MNEPRSRGGFWRALPWALFLLTLLVACAIVGWPYRHHLRSDEALWRAAQEATGDEAAALYALLDERIPELGSYWLLWSAQARLPHPNAVADLVAAAQARPDSPVAFEAYVALARYYAGIESPQTVTAYQEALKLDDRADTRLELARYLEEQRATAGAYRQYITLLGSARPDAFVGMRRTAPDALTLARDLLARGYRTDVLDALHGVEACDADCLRAQALVGLGRGDEAVPYQQACAACTATPTPTPASAEPDAAATEEPAPTETEEPTEPLPLDSDDPIDWWSYTWSLEEDGQLDLALETYLRIAATDAYVNDDAAYRAYVLANRQRDMAARDAALARLTALQPNWLAYRATGTLRYQPAADFPPQAMEELAGPLLGIVTALEALGRDDLALAELRFAGRVSEIPEVLLAVAQALDERGQPRLAWSLAASELRDHPYAPLGTWQLAYPRVWEELALEAAARQNIDPALLWAIMRQESAYDPDAVSYVGARGLMQFMPATQQQMAESAGRVYVPGDAFVPAAAIDMGARYLRFLTDLYGERADLVVMAYNAGPGAVNQWLDDPQIQDEDDMLRFAWYGETREYMTRVLLDRELYRQVWAGE